MILAGPRCLAGLGRGTLASRDAAFSQLSATVLRNLHLGNVRIELAPQDTPQVVLDNRRWNGIERAVGVHCLPFSARLWRAAPHHAQPLVAPQLTHL